VVYLTKEQAQDHSHFEGPGGEELDVVTSQLLVEWFADNYKAFGAKLEFVTNKSQEGSQFVKGFGGVGGALPIPSLPLLPSPSSLLPLVLNSFFFEFFLCRSSAIQSGL